MFLLIFCLSDLFISGREVFKSPAMILGLSTSLCSSIGFLTYVVLCSVVKCIHVRNYYIFLDPVMIM